MTIRVLASLVMLTSLAGLPVLAHSEPLQGTPLLRRYLPEEYKATPEHWSITTDREGRLFVGNGEGVLRYDGEQWSLIALPGRYLARKVVTGQDGRIYVGSYDTFGWLQDTPDGETVYRELLTAVGLKGIARDVGDVWQILPTAKGVYFRSASALHFLSHDQRQARSWPLGENQRVMYAQGEELFARIEGLGFSRFVDGRFVLEPGGAAFARARLLGVVDQPGWRLLIGDAGFHRADAAGIRPMPGNAGSELLGQQAYSVLQLADGSFVVGTLTGELFRYGRDGRLRERISLGSSGILALGTDQQGGVWAATERDLVRMSMPSPWSFIGAMHGLEGTVYDFEWHEDALWLATNRGVMRMTAASDGRIQAQPMPWLDFEGFALASTGYGLLIAHREGLLVLDPGAARPRTLLQTELGGVLELVASSKHPNRIYGLGDLELYVVTLEQGRWQLGTSLPLAGASATSLLETGPGELWFGDSRGGPQRWTLDAEGRTLRRKEIFGPREGLGLDPQFGSSVYLLDGHVHAVSGKRGFRFVAGRFVVDEGAPFKLVDRPDELVVEQTPLGTYAFSRRQMWFRAHAQPSWQPLHLGSPLGAGYNRLRYNGDGVVRVATWNGLLQFDPARAQPAPASLVLALEHVIVEDADGSLRRLPLAREAAPSAITSGSRLDLRVCMVSMDSRAEFRHRLQGPGQAGDWSRWGGRDLSIPAATAGEFVLTIEARTASGRSAAPLTLHYQVLPRWHDQWWARLLGALLMIGIGAVAVRGSIRVRTERLANANRALEARIGKRTRELEISNRQLAELATEDALTGVANRRAMQNGLQREWVRCLDQRRPLSVLMIDVDHFKRYNDAHGHLEGDVLLRTIAQNLHALHDPARELLARFGGEEFALLLPGVSQDDALLRAEDLRVEMHERVSQVTISIGVSGFEPNARRDSMDLLRRADAALYRAKRAGRNRVEVDVDPAEVQPA